MNGNCDKLHLKIFKFLKKKKKFKKLQKPIEYNPWGCKFRVSALGGRLGLGQVGERVTGWNNLTNFAFQ